MSEQDQTIASNSQETTQATQEETCQSSTDANAWSSSSTDKSAETATDPTNTTNDKQPEKQGLWHNWIRPILTVLLIMIVVRSSLIDWNDVPSRSMDPTIHIGDRVAVNKLAYGFQIPLSGPVIEVPFINARFQSPLRNLPMMRWGDGPQRGDIVTFWLPENEITLASARANPNAAPPGTRMIKRVVGMPGDTLSVKDGIVYINGKADTEMSEFLDEGNATVFSTVTGDKQHLLRLEAFRTNERQHAELVLGEDQYFCMGDNRDHSSDSRVWGIVERRAITGRAFSIVVSFKDRSFFKPNWKRFFKSLY